MILKNLTNNYSTIPNELITDSSISPGAFRLYCYLASKPETWVVQNADIKKQLQTSDKTLSKFFKELINAGWLERKKITPTEAKKLGIKAGSYIYVLHSSKSEETSKKETSSKKEEMGISKSEETSKKEKTSPISNNDININKTEFSNTEESLTISSLTNYITRELSSKGINAVRKHKFFGEKIKELKKDYSLEEIKEVIDYALNSEKWIKTITVPQFFDNNFEIIKLELKKEKIPVEEERWY